MNSILNTISKFAKSLHDQYQLREEQFFHHQHVKCHLVSRVLVSLYSYTAISFHLMVEFNYHNL